MSSNRVAIDDSCFKVYQSRRVVKQALFVFIPEGVESIIWAEWGAEQRFVGPWYAVYAHGEVIYGVAKKEFEETHAKADELENGYYKNTAIEAYRYEGPDAIVVTMLESGVEETKNMVGCGDWIVRWPHGEIGVMIDEKFRERYEVA